MKTEISIIIPVYNGAAHIRRCLDSILTQDYKGCQIIIIDDGSNDNTLELCHQIVGENKNFLIIHQENQGVSAARNKGLLSAEKEWIYFLDADDELDQNALAVMKNSLNFDGQWIIMHYRKHIEGTENIFSCSTDLKTEEIFYGKKGFSDLLNSELFMYPCGKLYKTEIIRKNQLKFPLNIVYGEDIRFNLQYFRYVEQYIVRPESAFIYHIRQGQGAGSTYYENSFQMQMDIDTEILEMVNGSYGLGQDTVREINPYFFRQGINTASAYLTIWKGLPFSHRRKEIRKIMKDLRFRSFLECEWECGRLNRIDYLLLKKGYFLFYYGIHRLYTLYKQFTGRGKEK